MKEKKLILNKENGIIQYQGRTYNFPVKMNLRTDAINKHNAFGNIQLLAGELGLEMYDDGISCTECKYNGVFAQAIKNGSFSGDPTKVCKYDNKDEPQWLSYFYKKDFFSETGFAARMNPCVADTALLRVLIELNVFKKFEVKTDLDVKIFPYIREVNEKNEKKFVKLYKEHFKN
jgi:hypothetical protein